MEALKKKIEIWLNKPKADDQSLLARFYYADKNLSAIASELDSFDGRSEPDRCARLVGKLRQEQDRVLCIINQIMDDLLVENERALRNFRVKFPEEVLQESLAGQLWFGAECLAAGSSIMHREAESNLMRPLAKAVTKSLDNVRNLLRDQCLRHNTPNAPTIKLDTEDELSEKLYESLLIFDRLFAEFEFLYVSAMVQVKSKEEYEAQELICVLFSESLQYALRRKLLTQDQIDSCDPGLMFSIPRLSIVAGLMWFDAGPLNLDDTVENMSEMFKPFRKLLLRMRDLLKALSKEEIVKLEKLLCSNEISISSSSNPAEKSLGQHYVEAEHFLFTSNNNEEEGATGEDHMEEENGSEELEKDRGIDLNEYLTKKVEGMSVDCNNPESSIHMYLPSNVSHIPCLSKTSCSREGDNILHRLFVCIAGVADQLQTNFASDLRHILKNVFLINCSQTDNLVTQQTTDIQPFVFHATEDNVLSNDYNSPIQTAEEVVVEDADDNGNIFAHSDHLEIVENLSNDMLPAETEHSFLRPPQWIPDGDAPRCMACAVQFTPFRRRHHCRNCGGVFCNVCSNSSKPLPKYGFNKAVRVCKECIQRDCEN